MNVKCLRPAYDDLLMRNRFLRLLYVERLFSAHALSHIQEYRLDGKRRWQRTLLEQVAQNLFFS